MTDTSFVKTCERLLGLTLIETRKLVLFMDKLGEDFGFFSFEPRSDLQFDFKRSFGKDEVGSDKEVLTYSALFAFMKELNDFLDEPISIERINFLDNISIEIMRLLNASWTLRLGLWFMKRRRPRAAFLVQ